MELLHLAALSRLKTSRFYNRTMRSIAQLLQIQAQIVLLIIFYFLNIYHIPNLLYIYAQKYINKILY